VTRIGVLGTTLDIYWQRLQLLATAKVVPSALILFTLMMEAICSSETSVLIRVTRLQIPHDGILLKAKYFEIENSTQRIHTRN
jgi:hypothetical protein